MTGARAEQEARGWLDAGRPVQALALLGPELAARPDDARVLLLTAAALRLAGRAEEALPYADRAAATAPEATSPRFERFEILLALRRFDDATAAADDLVRAAPDDAAAHQARALVDVRAGRVDAVSERHARQALALDPEDPVLHLVFGVVVEGRGDRVTAGQAYRHVLTVDPENASARWGLARLRAAAGDSVGFADDLIAIGRSAPTSTVAPLSLVAAVFRVIRPAPAILLLGAVLTIGQRAGSVNDPSTPAAVAPVQSAIVTVLLVAGVAFTAWRGGPVARRAAREGLRALPLVRRHTLGLTVAFASFWISAVPMPAIAALVVAATGTAVGVLLTGSAIVRGRRHPAGWLAGSRFEDRR